MAGIIPATTSQVVSAPAANAGSTSATTSTTGVDKDTLAGNFQTFLTLLTTQLKNQNPLDPLDTNQFTSQLVQFAQVEQQLKQNDQLATLVSLQKTAQSTAALEFVGQTVSVDGATAPLQNGTVSWDLTVPKPATATVNIKSATGQTVYTTNMTMNAGHQAFTWDGKDASGVQWPNGNYTIAISAKDANGQAVAIPTAIQATVDSADLTQSPPLLSIAGQDYTLDKIKRVVRNSN
ncbi:MAG: flagellar basal-body rod modification protein FlgD [Sphingomonadales bacterium]|jgi:flagellar basal-body rod modification protein FlgD|nr:flagellar basal-body rod modification protein FlgD [Sphingomonadales bacterium]